MSISQVTFEQLPHPGIDRLGQLFFKEARLPGNYVPKVFNNNWKALIHKGLGTIFGAYAGVELIGVIGMVITPDINDGELVAQEAFWFMDPDVRGSLTGVRLFDAAVEWAYAKQAKRICMASVLGPHAEKLRKFYMKFGFRPVEVNYHYEVT